MDPRRLKVGDIVDDYCPRERRLTDHAIVAMIDETIRQTRCTACESEHPYKEARTPRTRRKNTPAALYQEVLTNVTEGTTPPVVPAVPVAETRPSARVEPADVTEAAKAPEAIEATEAVDAISDVSESVQETPETAEEPQAADEGPVHRPLIRATLPRPQGDTPAQRPIPEFTIRQTGGRGGRFRDDFRGNGFRGAGRNGGGHSGQGRHGSSSQQPRGRHRGRPGPHKKRSR